MSANNVKKLVRYWKETAKRDAETMQTLYRTRRYPETLFFGHLVLEKTLKAIVVQRTKKQTSYTHNLLQLMREAGLNLTKGEQDLLDTVNEFNLRSRYPDEKLAFYKKCTAGYTEMYVAKIKKLYHQLCL